jgi:23S rRNA (adenine-N6)-dimethyltransferase
VPGRSRPGRSHGRNLGQHFLESAALADRIAADAAIASSDHVVEIGAGTGTLTTAIAARGARVLALEIDPTLATVLARRFAGSSTVTVFECDAIEFPLPCTPYRVVANPPFNRTAAILQRLLDRPEGALERADLIVQWQVARALAQPNDRDLADLVGASWAPWWSFRRARRLPAALFRPAPSVDAAVLTVTRRQPALLPAARAEEYIAFLRERFAASARPATAEEWIRRFRQEQRGGKARPQFRGDARPGRAT